MKSRSRLLVGLAAVCLLSSLHTAYARDVTTVDIGATNPVVSPDGKSVAVSVLGKIWLVPIEGGRAQQITVGSDWDSQPAFSPDGRFLAFGRHGPTGAVLVRLDLRTQQTYPLWHDSQAGRFRTFMNLFHDIEWDAAGQAVFFEVLDGVLSSVNPWTREVTRGPALWPSSAFALVKGSGPARVITDYRHPALMARPSRIAADYLTFDSFRLALLDPESKTLTPIVADRAVRYAEPRLTVDGRSVIYLEREDGAETLVVRNLQTGATRRVLSELWANREIAVHPEGKSVVMIAGRRLCRVDLATGATTPIAFTAEVATVRPRPADLIITNARLFDGTGAPVRERVTVEVRDGRIRTIGGDAGAQSKASGADVIDANGRFLMAGLMDNHAHVGRAMAFLLADWLQNGITSVRDPGGLFDENMDLRDALVTGTLQGPDLYALSTVLDADNIYTDGRISLRTPERARDLVKSFARRGASGIKLYSRLSPEVSRAAIEAARAVGLRVLSHNGATSWEQAVDAGVNGITHIDLHYAAHTPFSGAGNVARPATEPEWDRLEALFKKMAAMGVALDPTVIKTTLSLRPPAQYEAIKKQAPDRDFAQEEQWTGAVLRMAYRAGVRLTAGTDSQSLALFGELEAYEKMGLPNDAILQTATINGARWLGKEDFGTVEVGKRADLILVDGDPLQQMKDLRNVVLVVKDGRIVVKKSW